MISDAFDLFNGESNAFAFLPAINLGYIFWKTTTPSVFDTTVVLASLIVSAVAFNILTYGDFDRYNSGSENIPLSDSIALVLTSCLWILALGYSLRELYDLFSSSEIWPVLLTAISLLFVVLILTHAVLSRSLSFYRPNVVKK